MTQTHESAHTKETLSDAFWAVSLQAVFGGCAMVCSGFRSGCQEQGGEEDYVLRRQEMSEVGILKEKK